MNIMPLGVVPHTGRLQRLFCSEKRQENRVIRYASKELKQCNNQKLVLCKTLLKFKKLTESAFYKILGEEQAKNFINEFKVLGFIEPKILDPTKISTQHNINYVVTPYGHEQLRLQTAMNSLNSF